MIGIDPLSFKFFGTKLVALKFYPLHLILLLIARVNIFVLTFCVVYVN